MEIPKNLITELEFLCEANDYGMLVLNGSKFHCILLGSRDYSPDQMSVVIAHALLAGVINSELNELNEQAKEARAREPKM